MTSPDPDAWAESLAEDRRDRAAGRGLTPNEETALAEVRDNEAERAADRMWDHDYQETPC